MIALVVVSTIYVGTLLVITWVDMRQTEALQQTAVAQHETMLELQNLIKSVKLDTQEVVEDTPEAEASRDEIKKEIKDLKTRVGKTPKVITVKVPVPAPRTPVHKPPQPPDPPKKVFGK